MLIVFLEEIHGQDLVNNLKETSMHVTFHFLIIIVWKGGRQVCIYAFDNNYFQTWSSEQIFISNYHGTYKNQTKREGFFFFLRRVIAMFNNPLHPDIIIHILHTLLYMLLLVLTRRIYLEIKASQVGSHFLYSHDLNKWFSSISVRRNQMLATFRI